MKNNVKLGVCPICKKNIKKILGKHILIKHGEEEFKKAILKAKEDNLSDSEIGKIYGITFRQLEKLITEKYGINISNIKNVKKIKYWEPKNFKEETTTVWSFKQRGDWATHNGFYRGNWSPYIPRNVILKYSNSGDTVLDYFVGSGTTTIEAKLLKRKCIAKDINHSCIELTLDNLNFIPPFEFYEPRVTIGDARNLSDIRSNSIDLICSHPPYAGIIKYSSNIEGDLSNLEFEDFIKEMKKVAQESWRVLKNGGKCAILIGDTRKKKHIIPMGFRVIKVFLEVGFKLKELIIKRQHNCKTTGFWKDKSIKYNFLLLAHEYLPIFEKQINEKITVVQENPLNYDSAISDIKYNKHNELNELETTSVWIFTNDSFKNLLEKNVICRYSDNENYFSIFFYEANDGKILYNKNKDGKVSLIFIGSPFLDNNPELFDVEKYLLEIKNIINEKKSDIFKGGFLVIEIRDIRIGKFIEPLGIRILDMVSEFDFWLKEIVILVEEKGKNELQIKGDNNLEIRHKYLFVYEKK